ncbi:ankyrin repeat-containing domain protein [Trichoderma compactum]
MNAHCGKWASAVHAAVSGARIDVVKLLVRNGADVNSQPALFVCTPRRDTQRLEYLLDHGMKVDMQDGQHGTALHKAVTEDNSTLFQLLLDRGADINALNRGADPNINHEYAEYGTALHAMMTTRHAGPNWREGINVLLKHHTNPNIISERLGSALHLACAIAHETLLEHCPNINVNVQGGTFNTALQAAAYSGQTLPARMLLNRKADVNARGGKYHSALNGAIISGHWNIVKILLDAGATPDCHLRGQPDEDWLQTVLEEDGQGAAERYRKFWEVELEKNRGGGEVSNS